MELVCISFLNFMIFFYGLWKFVVFIVIVLSCMFNEFSDIGVILLSCRLRVRLFLIMWLFVVLIMSEEIWLFIIWWISRLGFLMLVMSEVGVLLVLCLKVIIKLLDVGVLVLLWVFLIEIGIFGL